VKTTPAVSILTPVHNHSRFLGQCIESVLGQTYSGWEQIIVDDGSTDGTPEVVRGYQDARIRYVRQDRRGIERLAETYNHALSLSRAPLVAILEGDDYWPSHKLATLAPAFDDGEVVLAYGWTEAVGRLPRGFSRRIPGPTFERRFGSGVLSNTPVGSAARAMCDYHGLTFTYPCSVILRREALRRIGGFQERPGLPVADHPTFLRLSLEGRFHFARDTMGYWRVHDAGTTVRQRERILEGVRREILRFRAAFGERAGLTGEQWRSIEEGWRPWVMLRLARQLLLERRWSEARQSLRTAMATPNPRLRALALAAFVGSYAGVTTEWVYRTTGRPWFRRVEPGRSELVFPEET
jgi:glycosyltransferase involved in cell wall biosynthesis